MVQLFQQNYSHYVLLFWQEQKAALANNAVVVLFLFFAMCAHHQGPFLGMLTDLGCLAFGM